MSKTVRRIAISEDVDFVPDVEDSELFLAYGIADLGARERIAFEAVGAMRSYENARARQVEIERALGEQGLFATH